MGRSEVQVCLALVRVHPIDKTDLRVIVRADLAPPGKELQPVGLIADGIGDLSISVALDKVVFNMSERTGNLWMANLDGRR